MNDFYNERELLNRVAQSDREAFEIVYTQHLNNIYRYVFLFTKSKEASEEILQTVFMKIWERREKLPEIVSFKSYLYRCAKNLLIDEIRRKRNTAEVYAALKPVSGESYERPDGRVVYNDYLKISQKAIDFLPPKRKQIVQLHIREQYSFNEIADKLSISKSVVKKQLYAGLRFIRTYLKAQSGLNA